MGRVMVGRLCVGKGEGYGWEKESLGWVEGEGYGEKRGRVIWWEKRGELRVGKEGLWVW